MMRRYRRTLHFILLALTASAVTLSAETTTPVGFAFDRPESYTDYPAFHGGPGTVRMTELFGPDDYQSNHHFLRKIVIPPKSGIGEYRLTDSDEVLVTLVGFVNVTIDGRTGRIAPNTMVPVKRNQTVGVINPTGEEASVLWIATVVEKGRYATVDTKTDLSTKNPEGIIPFPWMHLNYWLPPEPPKGPSHNGAGSIIIPLWSVGFDYFATNWTAYYIIVPAGSSIGYHKHPTNEEHYYIVSGTGRATVDDVTLPQGPGDCSLCPVGSSHGFYNNGDEDLVMFFTNCPMPGVEGWGTVENYGVDLVDR